VSVVVATRDRLGPLKECLEGIAAQTYQTLEVIVSDDGSSAETREAYRSICPALGDRLRFVMFEHPDTPSTGPAAVRNRGIRAATGEFVAFCDDDDLWIRQDHLTVGVQALEAQGADFYFSNLVATRDRQVADYVWYPELHLLKRGVPVLRAPDVFAADLETVLRVVSGSVIHPDCWLLRKSLLDATGEFWERLWFPEDYNLMMRLLDRAQSILFRSDACVDYRLPGEGSHSLRSSLVETIMQEIMASEHVRMVCEKPVVRRHASARQAWGLRRLGRQHRANGNAPEASLFAWEGFWTYPTLGALKEYLVGHD
jgi:glycosyltransferase involved in cell wall biosynthesis